MNKPADIYPYECKKCGDTVIYPKIKCQRCGTRVVTKFTLRSYLLMAFWIFPIIYGAYIFYHINPTLVIIAVGLPISFILIFLPQELMKSRKK